MICFVNSPISWHARVLGEQRQSPPLGILYLAAAARQAGEEVRVIDPHVEGLSLLSTVNEIARSGADRIGISSLTPGIRAAVELARQIKAAGIKAKIMLGGSHISADPTFADRFPCFDIPCFGECENYFNDKIQLTDLDTIPLPARDLVDMRRYNCHKEKTLYLITSRGCPFNCAFCSRPAVSKKYRVRSAENVCEEIAPWYAAGWRRAYFLDDCLTVSRSHVSSLCSEIRRRKWRLRWGSNTRADMVDRHLLDEMYSSGCDHLIYGVESGSERIRNQIIGKGVSDEQIIKAIAETEAAGIDSGMFLMMGFPTEGAAELEETVLFPLRTQATVIGVHLTKPMPGSHIFSQWGKTYTTLMIDEYANGKLGEGFVESWPIYDGETSRTALEAAKQRCIRGFYFRFGWLARHIWRYFRNPRWAVQDARKAWAILRHGQSKEAMS